MTQTHPFNSGFETDQRRPTDATTSAPVIRWGPVWGASLIAFGLFAAASLLWLALAYTGSGSNYWKTNLDWWEGGSALAAWLIGGSVVSRMVPDRMSAAVNGATVWALTEIGGLLALTPLAFRHLGGAKTLPGPLFWILFGSVAIGLPLAVAGAESMVSDKDKGAGRSSSHAATVGSGRSVPTQSDPASGWAGVHR